MKFQMPIPLIKSMSLHLAFGVLIFAGMDFKLPQESTEMTISQPVIEAVAVDTNAVEEQVKRIEDQKKLKQKAEEDRIAELERRANEAERKRKQQEQEAVEIEQRNKRQREERKKAEQAAIAARKKQEQEKAKAKAAEAERKRKELERKKAEEQARKAKEAREKEEKALKEAQRKKAEAAEKARQERALQDQLEAEQAVRQQRRSKQVLTEVQKYQALIHQAIQRQLIVDNSMKGKSCQLNVRLASSGLVIQVKELGGDPILCRAAKSAVFKAGTLPVSKEADVYEKLRDINLTVEPEL
ncbi:cell envelope integrity protein TolA [Paraglaciecola chathamensis]|uniref:Colicin import membrane protein n=1 Tax=Paraglaciecola agarilytica NO2 TaxID=1125747 RepID=A0ABQ0I7L9_9ALTE|nr:cell envelope integrity protein TolA [Paraglaciecola agarilytica]GAC05360.1 colicin import membrane protein [Paraglaciecola agarilytica NO2]